MFLRGAPVFFEGLRSRANAPGTKMNLQAMVGRFLAQVLQIIVIKLLESVEVGDEQGIGLERRGVIDELAGFPAQRADGEFIEAEFDPRLTRGGRGSGPGRRPRQYGQSSRRRDRGL